jgi:hypothetical protein
MKEIVLTWLNRFLVFDVFVVLIGFLWLIVALIARNLGVSAIFDIWYSLWIPLFNPAIGILFLGAILSWLIKKIEVAVLKK